MGIAAGAATGGSYWRLNPEIPRERHLETRYKKRSSRAPECSVCGKIIPADLTTIQDDKIYCKECFKTNVRKPARKTNSSRHMIR